MAYLEILLGNLQSVKWLIHYCIISLISWILLACSHEKIEKISKINLVITAPDSVIVGEKFNIGIQVIGDENETNIYLLAQNSWGITSRELTVNKTISVMFSDTIAGLLSLKLNNGGKLLAQKDVVVLPRKAAQPLDTYLGSKSIIANGESWAMITATPTDKYGNMLADSTPVNFDLLRTDNQREHRMSLLKYGLTHQKIYAKLKAGKTFVGVSLNEINSREKELLEVAGHPLNFKIMAMYNTDFADARQTFKIKTDVLKDPFGNIVSEGTLVVFQCKDPNQTIRQVSGYSLDGVAEIFVQNPISEGNFEVSASVYGGGKSNKLNIPFVAALQDIPLEFDTQSQKLTLKIGTLRGKLNQLFPNGLAVKLIIDLQKPKISEVINGFVSFDLSDLPAGTHTLKIYIADNVITKELTIK